MELIAADAQVKLQLGQERTPDRNKGRQIYDRQVVAGHELKLTGIVCMGQVEAPWSIPAKIETGEQQPIAPERL
jgi:hypothetical protein